MEEELVDADDLQPGLLTDKKHPLIESFKTEKDQLHLSSCNMNTAPVHLNNCSLFQSIYCTNDVISRGKNKTTMGINAELPKSKFLTD